MRQIVNTKSKLLFAPLMTKITCDLVSLLDHESIEQVVVGMCNYPEFFWMLISKRMKLLKKLQQLKEKLQRRLQEDVYNVNMPGIPEAVMRSIGYEEYELEFLISLAMMAKPSILIPKRAQRNIQKKRVELQERYDRISKPLLTFPEAMQILTCFTTFSHIKREVGACRIQCPFPRDELY